MGQRIPVRRNAVSVCTIEYCSDKVRAHGYCNKHWLRIQRHGDPEKVGRQASWLDAECSVDSCTAKVLAKALCKTHYSRFSRTGTTDPRPRRQVEQCRIEQCSESGDNAGYCIKHYRKKTRDEAFARDPWRYRKYSSDRRKRVKEAKTILFDLEQLRQRFAVFGFKCWLCGSDANSMDHVKPLSKGGWHCLSNLRPACLSCNSRKRDRWFGVNNLDRLIV